MNWFTIALPKGRLLDEALNLLGCCGIDVSAISEKTRSLVFTNPSDMIRLIMVRPVDVPIYVENGAADIGFVGKDILVEGQHDVYELMDLQFGRCRFVLASPDCGQPIKSSSGSVRIASKFPQITASYLAKRGLRGSVITLSGAVELAPAVGLADMIVDIVDSGRTLQANGLHVVDDILTSTVRLIANRASYRLKYSKINEIQIKLNDQLENRGDQHEDLARF